MNKVLLKSVFILSPNSKYHEQVVDVLVVDGQILKIGQAIKTDEHTQVIDGRGKFLSPGFFDLNVNFGEPGLETKEDLMTGCMTAAAGGFTGLALMPNTQPTIHTKSEVAYICSKTKNNVVDVHQMG